MQLTRSDSGFSFLTMSLRRPSTILRCPLVRLSSSSPRAEQDSYVFRLIQIYYFMGGAGELDNNCTRAAQARAKAWNLMIYSSWALSLR